MATEILRPSAVGDEESLPGSTSGVGNHWQDVDEVTPDEEVTTVYSDSTDTWYRDLYNLPASSGSGTINHITIYVRCFAYYLIYQASIKVSLKSDSTVTDSAEKTLAAPDTWETLSQQWVTNPADSEAWEWADIDALQIGVTLRRAHPALPTKITYCTQVYVEIDYTPGPQVYDETGHEQVILVAHGEVDTQAMAETGKLQAIPVVVGEADGLLYNETGKEQIILATIGKSDTLTMDETGKEQVALVVVGKEEGWLSKSIRTLDSVRVLGEGRVLDSLRETERTS